METMKTIILATLAGVEVLLYIITPIILVILWVTVVGFDNWMNYFFYGMGLLATLFRGIKISGFMR